MDIQVLGAHNCESQNSRLISLLIDGTLAIDAGSLTSSLSFAAQQRLRAILLTHQHYDHVRDVLTLALNLALQNATISIYSIRPVYDALSTHLLDGKLYPKFLEQPPQNPTIKFTVIEAYKTNQIEGYGILAIPVNHTDPTVGYQVTSSDGKVVFYTSDTGAGLANCWRYVSPQLLIVEVTVPDSYEEFARKSGHLTPSLLKQELISFKEVKGYLPPVIVVHMSPNLEKEIAAEVAAVARDVDNPITLAYEGMQLHL
jgi:phosphoribosyl 1,2-cyclic phosphodiesterase